MHLDCPSCGVGLRVPDSATAAAIRCPKCGATLSIRQRRSTHGLGSTVPPNRSTSSRLPSPQEQSQNETDSFDTVLEEMYQFERYLDGPDPAEQHARTIPHVRAPAPRKVSLRARLKRFEDALTVLMLLAIFVLPVVLFGVLYPGGTGTVLIILGITPTFYGVIMGIAFIAYPEKFQDFWSSSSEKDTHLKYNIIMTWFLAIVLMGIGIPLWWVGEARDESRFQQLLSPICADQKLAIRRDDNGAFLFPDGHTSVKSIDWTRDARKMLSSPEDGEIMGYETSGYAHDHASQGQGMHHFLLIRKRYILDSWYPAVRDSKASALLDLENDEDLEEATRRYGPRDRWSKAAAQE